MNEIVWQHDKKRVIRKGADLLAQSREGTRWKTLEGIAESAVLKEAMLAKPAALEIEQAQKLLSALFGQHPWHGASAGPDLPKKVMAYIELVPTDTVKYELDKASGLLKIDRPHRFSNFCPALYGFIPQTYCAERVGKRCSERTGKRNIKGDGDPLDICVLTSKSISHGDILVRCIPIGGLRMIDGQEADDKIIAVLENDPVYGAYKDLKDCPVELIDPLRHYFLTYKQIPGEEKQVRVNIAEAYDRKEAYKVIGLSVQDYAESYGSPQVRISELASLLAGRIGH